MEQDCFISYGTAGDEVLESSDEAAWQFIIQEPNRFRTLIPYLLEPSKLSAYVAANCSSQTLGGPTRIGQRQKFHFRFLSGHFGQDSLDPNNSEPFGTCVDTFGGYDQFAQYALT